MVPDGTPLTRHDDTGSPILREATEGTFPAPELVLLLWIYVGRELEIICVLDEVIEDAHFELPPSASHNHTTKPSSQHQPPYSGHAQEA